MYVDGQITNMLFEHRYPHSQAQAHAQTLTRAHRQTGPKTNYEPIDALLSYIINNTVLQKQDKPENASKSTQTQMSLLVVEGRGG